MMMDDHFEITASQIDKIVGFLGYGSPAGSVWFIGKEEGLGNMDEGDSLRNLTERAKFESVMDLYQAHKNLLEEGARTDFDQKIPKTQVWKFMAKIMRAREGCVDWAETSKANEYIRTRLGRSDGQTFLTELSPIPASNGGDTRWIEMFAKRDSQLFAKIEKRKDRLKRLLKESSPSEVICYGLPKASEYAEVLGITWESVNERILKSRDSRCFLLPFFCCGQMRNSDIEHLLKAKLLNRTS
jgi:hypothetical protein